MAILKVPVPGIEFIPEQSTTQVPVAAGAGATFAAANNIGTVTTNAAHGLTLTPAAGTLGNYLIQPATSDSAETGTGTLIGNTFRILSIPSTTTFTIYTTVTGATVTATTWVPVFVLPNIPTITSGLYSGGPTMTGVAQPAPLFTPVWANCNLGANCVVQYCPNNVAPPPAGTNPAIILDQTTGNTPTTAPVYRTLLAASTSNQIWFGTLGVAGIFASGGAGTSRFSVIE